MSLLNKFWLLISGGDRSKATSLPTDKEIFTLDDFITAVTEQPQGPSVEYAVRCPQEQIPRLDLIIAFLCLRCGDTIYADMDTVGEDIVVVKVSKLGRP